ncbi:hypothetical protein UA42_01105 [Photobacterium kishitanii]|uniref:DUF2141 domain-containing protein n=1 Tax=Photobacterium kishitanii TaxID=318456 RepID=UPI0005D3456B|nr:DUF2141 domain-containing protein [Photobacterium kishitanii]KJG63020.1 hypothetical protein UA42_01105 [Photobacterium kishitanii]
MKKKWANKTKIQHWVSYVTVIFLIAITTNYVSAQAVSPLTIKISNLVDSKTLITVLVYDEKDDLNGRATVHYKKYSPQQVIKGITVESLPAGNYAILAFQDKDENYYLTRNNDGMPVEYFGLSNNPVLQGSLVMEQIKFSHHKSQTQTINFY